MTKHTKTYCKQVAKKYKIRSEFAASSTKIYQYTKKHGWFDECVEHMMPGKIGRPHKQVKNNPIVQSPKRVIVKKNAEFIPTRKIDTLAELRSHAEKEVVPIDLTSHQNAPNGLEAPIVDLLAEERKMFHPLRTIFVLFMGLFVTIFRKRIEIF